jgi:serine-type D-Ala-D-Ala carboxypeptidase/endopeptidase (penicillin-binding protein 4)
MGHSQILTPTRGDNHTMSLMNRRGAARTCRSALVACILPWLGCVAALTAGAAWALPPEVAAALARAGVPQSAVSVLVQALPATPTLVLSPAPVAVNVPDSGNLIAPATSATTVAVASGPRLAHRADASVNPASVMKLITTYTALHTLGPDYTWKNRLLIDGTIVAGGVLEGNLILRGGGDPKLVLERINEVFERVRAKGIREIRGDIILDRSAFNVPDKNPADFDDEPLRPYNAAPDGLLVNFKSLIFTFTPDIAGKRVLVKYEPPIAGVDIPTELPLSSGLCGDWKARLQADFFNPAKVSFAGRYSATCGDKVWPVAYSAPRAYAGRVIEGMWLASGGKLTGSVREDVVPRTSRPFFTAESLPLSDIIADINKFSNNVMAQQVFLTLSLGARSGRAASFDASKAQLAAWWKKNLPGYSPPVIENGSGLSRKERTNVLSLTGLLQHAAASKQAEVFAASLGVAGVDGTVARMKDRNSDSVAIGNAQLKTGTLRDVTAVAGYATGRSGQRYTVVGIINHPNAPAARPALDKLVEWTIQDVR